MKKSTIIFSFLAGLLLFSFPVCSQTQLFDRTRLTWDDFTPASADSIEMASHLVIGVSQALVQHNKKLCKDLYLVEVDTKSSLYDPSKITDWDLRYNQILYDMALLSMKQATQDNHNGKVGIYEIYARYRQIYDESKEQFIINSNSGRDTTVIKDYEIRLKDQIADIKIEDFYSVTFLLTSNGVVPKSDTRSNYYLVLMGYYENNCFLTGYSNDFGLWNGFNISAEFHFKSDYRFEMQFSRLWSNVKTPCFYYDSYNYYYWNDIKKANEMIFRFGVGFNVMSNDRISLTPFAGFQSADIYQNTGIKGQKGGKNRSYIPDGEGVYLGMDVDYSPKGTFGLRLKLFGSYGVYNGNVNIWSLNTGIALLLPEQF